MATKLLLVLVCLAAVLLGGYFVLWLTAPRHNVSRESFERLQPGMAEPEVEALLGGPAGDYSSGPLVAALPPEGFLLPPPGVSEDDYAAMVLEVRRSSPDVWYHRC